ncbi:phage tail tape measure protein [uncultured Desulfovibrio sp.]|uniref:phage tail tape measure protein n=1 Tax=uncultured Desulfovibrio sp. TaxID=167968 RepID=UPI0026198C50|nr:phage tail tape measure protein [uncultured Desulfovibrio sp.]
MAGTVGVNFSIGAALSRTVASAFGTVQSRVKGLRSDLRGLETQSKAAARLSAAQARLATARARYAAAPTTQMRAALRTAVREFGNAHRAAREYGISVENAGRAQERLAQRIQRTQAALSRQQRLQANQAKRRELQGQALGVIGAAMTVAAPVKLAIDYESTFADLKKVANFADAAQEKRVQRDIFAVARRAGISAGGMTAIAASAAESGVANDAQGNLDPAKLKQFLNDAAEMAVAYGISAEEAGKRLAIFQSRMGQDGMALTAAQTREMGDAMNYLASKTNATAAQTSEVLSRVGSVGVTAGLSAKSIVGLAGAFVSTSESPEVAATAMKSFLLTLSQGEAMSKTQKDAFAKIGIRNVKALAEGMKKGGPEAENTIMTVLQALRKVPEAEQAGIAKDIFGLESFASIAPLVNDPAKLAKAFSLANSKEAVGSQLREFETRSATTAGALDRLKTSTGVLGITVGSVLLPPLATAANTAVAVVKPVTALADRFPLVTKVVMMTAIALVALKVGALGGMYAATILSDGWTIARSVLTFFRPSVMLANAALARHKVAAIAAAAGTKIMAVGSRMAAAGQWVLNAALTANPIGIVVMAVAGLIAGLVYLYNTCEPVRAAFDAAFGWIGEKAAWVGSKLRAVGEWLGIVDEADDKADAKLAEATTTGVAPTTAALPPMPAAAPTAWTPDLSGMSPEATAAAFPGMAGGMAGGMSSSDMSALSGTSAPTFNLTFSLNGMPDADFGKRVIDGLKHRQGELEKLIASIVDEQRRLAYG